MYMLCSPHLSFSHFSMKKSKPSNGKTRGCRATAASCSAISIDCSSHLPRKDGAWPAHPCWHPGALSLSLLHVWGLVNQSAGGLPYRRAQNDEGGPCPPPSPPGRVARSCELDGRIPDSFLQSVTSRRRCRSPLILKNPFIKRVTTTFTLSRLCWQREDVALNAYFLIQLAFRSVLFCSYRPACRRGNAHKHTQGVVARKDFPRRAPSFSSILFQLNRALH